MQESQHTRQPDRSLVSAKTTDLPPERESGFMSERSFNVDQMLSASWDQLLARDLASEVKDFCGDKRYPFPELRRFFAIKGYRDLLVRLKTACKDQTSFDALKSVAREMRQYALDRPALWAATSRTATIDCAEWRAGDKELYDFIKSILAECGVHGQHAESAWYMLRSLVRGFTMHQILGSFSQVHSYDESFERMVEIYVAGVCSVGASARQPCATTPE